MKPENAAVFKELQAEVEESLKNEEDRRSYKWFEDASSINFWDYRNKNYSIITWFEINEDNTKWELLAEKLGLGYQEIQHCHKFHRGCPTREVFSRLEDKEESKDLSLKNVLEILEELGHHDILRVVPWQEGIEKFRNDCSNSTDVHKKVSKLVQVKHKYDPASFTLSVHQRPEILVGASNEGVIDQGCISTNVSHASPQPALSVLQSSPPIPQLTPSIPQSTPSVLDARVLMVFAQDARAEALKVADQLRNPQLPRGKIGVLLLSEPAGPVARQLRIDPCNSIHKWFKQVDFVVPVLSPQFLRQIQNRDWDSNCVDERRYNRFIYRLTLDHYVHKGSRNYKCRPLCPAEYFSEVMQSELVKGFGLLQVVWNCSSENKIEDFAKVIISELKCRGR
ncbi:uncharacterized protein [Cherax quadricarinatus]|nr:uncharacterized protein LOC128701875 isoform X2 [Cherax quadricarinatus]XP_053651814.1 uncharacterized protein LOC128701875 isoform X2 [Cherax quadricarinatus]